MPKTSPSVYPKRSIQIKREYQSLPTLSKGWSRKTESISLSKLEQDLSQPSLIKPISIQVPKLLPQNKRSKQMQFSKSECHNSTKKSMKNKLTSSKKVPLLSPFCNQVKINKLSKKSNKEESPHSLWIKFQEPLELKPLTLYHQWPTLLDIKQSSLLHKISEDSLQDK